MIGPTLRSIDHCPASSIFFAQEPRQHCPGQPGIIIFSHIAKIYFRIFSGSCCRPTGSGIIIFSHAILRKFIFAISCGPIPHLWLGNNFYFARPHAKIYFRAFSALRKNNYSLCEIKFYSSWIPAGRLSEVLAEPPAFRKILRDPGRIFFEPPPTVGVHSCNGEMIKCGLL